jgi:Na+/proline symporter
VLLFAFYHPFTDGGYLTATSAAFPFTAGDRVFPDFITKHMPSGLAGLVVAAIFAAAMSSSLNSIAATAVNDLYKPLRPKRPDQHYLKVSHVLTLVWGVVQIGVALAVRNQPGSALSNALSVASLINGPILGVFLVGTFLRRVSQPPALIGMVVSIAVMVYVFSQTAIAWTWYVFLGSLITFIVAWLTSFAFAQAPVAARDELASAAVTED